MHAIIQINILNSFGVEIKEILPFIAPKLFLNVIFFCSLKFYNGRRLYQYKEDDFFISVLIINKVFFKIQV